MSKCANYIKHKVVNKKQSFLIKLVVATKPATDCGGGSVIRITYMVEIPGVGIGKYL
ncbi:hypothetical protein SCACP_23340 [Sporomusa carbonis]